MSALLITAGFGILVCMLIGWILVANGLGELYKDWKEH